jgi:hypothetical protein
MGAADRICGHASADPTVRTRLGLSVQVFKSYFVRVIRVDQAKLRGAVELYANRWIVRAAGSVSHSEASPFRFRRSGSSAGPM